MMSHYVLCLPLTDLILRTTNLEKIPFVWNIMRSEEYICQVKATGDVKKFDLIHMIHVLAHHFNLLHHCIVFDVVFFITFLINWSCYLPSDDLLCGWPRRYDQLLPQSPEGKWQTCDSPRSTWVHFLFAKLTIEVIKLSVSILVHLVFTLNGCLIEQTNPHNFQVTTVRASFGGSTKRS